MGTIDFATYSEAIKERRQGVPANAVERRQGVPANAVERRQGVPANTVERRQSVPASTVAAAADADDWFAELDERIILIGHDTCFTRVQGIHRDGAYLWIQLACEDYHSERNVVLKVNGLTTTADVLAALRCSHSDSLLEIIHVPHRP